MRKSAELKVRLEPAVLKEVEALAAARGTSKSEVVRAGVLALKRQEERHAALERLKRAAQVDQKLLRRGARPKVPFGLR